MDVHQEKRVKRMNRVDGFPPEIRALVHEEGLTVIDAFFDCGVTKARQIRHLIEVVRKGSVEIGNRSNAPLLMQTLSRPAPPAPKEEG